jgi:hypothetical protein
MMGDCDLIQGGLKGLSAGEMLGDMEKNPGGVFDSFIYIFDRDVRNSGL